MVKNLLSIIIPVYNEEKRIDNINKILSFIKKHNINSEIIVINDGSTDNTLSKLNKFKNSIKIITYKTNKGKGYAVKKGMLSAKGQFSIFMDVDLSTSLDELPKFISESQKGTDVIIGSRKTSGAKVTKHQPIIRENMGKIFTLLSQIILNTNVTDFTCGFKMFSSKAVKKIFTKQTINRWGFDSEILFLANKFNYKIKEIPVSWEDNSMTKVRFPQDIFSSLYELFIIRVNNLFGKYS